jgi:N-acyl-L-homoserine lactone synthetase
MRNILDKISAASNTNELAEIVDEYLASVGETDNARGESYLETANRMGGNKILRAAECKWFELGA